MSAASNVLSFGLICKHAHQAWLAQNACLRAAWNVLARGLPAAEHALVAHRASEIAAAAEQAQRPVRLIATLDSARQTPNASELVGVQQMHRLALAIDAAFQNSQHAVPGDYDGNNAPEELDRMGDWRVGVHAAIYRSFTIGAALSGVYGEAYAKSRCDTRNCGISGNSYGAE
ncbi:hypothetical protein VHEMI10598 [[Torrubiella] hemipterigena]|uniref:Uncharacterized protein n=1 Tax=[Torrubiella] hemipterigena TaxID=1531966 RepID=A0A0A1TDI3_9HYPO|nr:hypothetical protein VHEMI10598 [[Torrubiella] hemipterigena]